MKRANKMNIELVNFLNKNLDIRIKTLEWRNAKHVTKYFKKQNIAIDTHLSWLKGLEALQPTCRAFFIEANGKEIGVAYFHSIDYKMNTAEWGIYIYDQAIRGHGFGKAALNKSLLYAKDILSLRAVYLEVLENNVIAINLYERVGFIKIGQCNDVLQYKKELI